MWINNTGGPKAGPLIEASPAEMERAFHGHVLASQVILRTLLPGMKQLGYGRIINILSTSTRVPIANLGVSNLWRAVASWARTLRWMLGPFGITGKQRIARIHRYAAGLEFLVNGAAQRWAAAKRKSNRSGFPSVRARRLGDPMETAQAIAFLASPLAGYINGVQLAIDGGRTGAL